MGGCREGILVELRRGREGERNYLGGERDAVFGRDIMIPISF